MKNVLRTILLVSTAMAVPDAVLAQEGSQPGINNAPIVVTARRREEDLQDVPIAITAIGGDDLAKRAIYNENDLQSAVPGLVIRQNGGVHSFNYVIRGQSVDTFTNSPPSVLPYVNDVQIVTHNASTFYDMAGIQVLKGPQGTLFGRNATGGAVLYNTAQPSDIYEAHLNVRYGNHDAFHMDGAVNIPLDEDTDTAAIRIATSYSSGGAFVEDFYTDDEYGDLEQFSVRASLRLEPASWMKNTTVFQHTTEDGTNTPNLLWSINPCGSSANNPPLIDDAACALSAANPTFVAYQANYPQSFQGDLADAQALQRQLGPWVNLSSVDPFHSATNSYLINTTEINLTDNLTLKNIFGYNLSKANDGYDYDGSPFHFFEIQGTLQADGIKATPVEGYRLRTKQISNEIQLLGTAVDDRLDYVVGFYYLDERRFVRSPLDFGNFSPIAAPFRFFYTARTQTESIAGFAQATFAVTDRLNFTGGFRYTRDETTIEQAEDSLFLNFFPANIPEVTKADKPSWNVSVDYAVTDDLLFYITHRGSWRSGGFNFSVAPVNVTAAQGGNLFLPETTKDIEVGLKYSGDSLGVPVTFNADVFHQWVNNIQRAAYILTPQGVSLLTVNVPKAEISGAEFDLSISPSDYVSFGISGNYTDARYTSNSVTVLGETINYGPFADVPEFSGTAFAEVGAPVGDAGVLTFRTDLYGQTKMNFSNVGDTVGPNTTLPGYFLVNARLTLSEIAGSDVSASLFARNLFNEKYFTGGNAGAAGGSTNVANPGISRMWGVELRTKF